ncbi:hypothetical protein BKA93DRAFT_930749, partial [Sparassis latifolia]
MCAMLLPSVSVMTTSAMNHIGRREIWTNFAMCFDARSLGLPEVVFAELFDKNRKASVRADLYELNSRVNTLRSKRMFSSLVITFPTWHAGGALMLHHTGRSWTIDSVASQKARVAYAAFFSDVEHEVLYVESGYRVNLTYNLSFADQPPAHARFRQPSHRAKSQFELKLQELLDDR